MVFKLPPGFFFCFPDVPGKRREFLISHHTVVVYSVHLRRANGFSKNDLFSRKFDSSVGTSYGAAAVVRPAKFSLCVCVCVCFFQFSLSFDEKMGFCECAQAGRVHRFLGETEFAKVITRTRLIQCSGNSTLSTTIWSFRGLVKSAYKARSPQDIRSIYLACGRLGPVFFC